MEDREYKTGMVPFWVQTKAETATAFSCATRIDLPSSPTSVVATMRQKCMMFLIVLKRTVVVTMW
ncbi:MAG: hypothetical protein IJ718_04780 [Paludibacteraceae bacterium]|nr:hypothetical protein [Paludibacteraceae bacterium]